MLQTLEGIQNGPRLSVTTPLDEVEAAAAATDVLVMEFDAFRDGRFLVLTDPVAQTWMERKTADIERWLTGMRRLQARIFPGNR